MKPYLASPAGARAVFETYHISAQKRYGQNFLIDASVPEAIVEAAGVTEDDCVLEIGPGIGTLTQYLASAAGKVIAVEIDRDLLPVLEGTLQFWPNVKVIPGDILKLDIPKLLAEESGGRPVKVVANLPYYITTPILMKLLESGAEIQSLTVMVQEEVADRIRSGPGTKAYGAISLAVQFYAVPEVALRVPPSAFMPQPGVHSAVLHLVRRREPAVTPRSSEYMFRLIKAAFLERRKTLVNAIAGYPPAGVTKADVAAALEKLGWPALVRGETLTLEQFAALSDALQARS